MRKKVQSDSLFGAGYSTWYSLGNSFDGARSSPVAVTAAGNPLIYKSWKTVTGTNGNTAALNSVGELYVWGDNNFGQWGNKTAGNTSLAQPGFDRATHRSSPTLVPSTGSWTVISVGGYSGEEYREVCNTGIYDPSAHVAGIKSDGTLWTWGYGIYGKLGAGNTFSRSSPTQLGTKTDWVDVACGPEFTIACDSAGDLYAWGHNYRGQLGDGTTIDRSSPVLVSSVRNYTKVYASGMKSFAVDDTNQLYWAGAGANATSLGYYPTSIDSLTHSSVTLGNNFSSGSMGPQHGLFIKTTGALYAAGINDYGQLGLNDTFSRSSFVQVGAGTNWSTVIVSASHTLALNNTGSLFVWGRNNYGQLGLGDVVNRSSPTLLSTGVSYVMAAGYNTFYVKTDGTLWAVGTERSGQLGNQDLLLDFDTPHINRSSPIQIGSGFTSNIFGKSNYRGAGAKSYINDGKLYMWGVNGYAAADDNATSWTPYKNFWLMETNRLFTKVPGSWSAVSMGTEYAVAIKSDGTLWSWGSNASYGQLGINLTSAAGNNGRSIPVLVSSDTTWKKVQAGFGGALALKGASSPYSLYGWGYYYITGQNSSINRSSPVIIGAANNWKDIGFSENSLTVYAVDKNDNIYVWGYNNVGQLGLSDTIDRFSPVLLATGQAGAKVQAGQDHGHIIKSDGSLWSTGSSAYGQTALGYTNVSSFTQVGSSSWTAVSAGQQHSLGIDAAGRLFAWGRNNYGQLMGPSPNIITYTYSTVQVGSGAYGSWTLVRAARDSSFASAKVDIT